MQSHAITLRKHCLIFLTQSYKSAFLQANFTMEQSLVYYLIEWVLLK
jgi:hypothetical protein